MASFLYLIAVSAFEFEHFRTFIGAKTPEGAPTRAVLPAFDPSERENRAASPALHRVVGNFSHHSKFPILFGYPVRPVDVFQRKLLSRKMSRPLLGYNRQSSSFCRNYHSFRD